MKITIPEEYREHFPQETMWLNLKDKEHCATKEYSKIFITRWQNGALLLLNEKEYDHLKESLEQSVQEKPDKAGILRFLGAGMQTALMIGGEVDVPDHLYSWLEGDSRAFSNNKIGIILT